MALLLRLSDVSLKQKEGDGKGGEYIDGGDEEIDYEDDYFLDLDMCQVCRKSQQRAKKARQKHQLSACS